LVDIEVNRSGLKDLEVVYTRIDDIHGWISAALEKARIVTRNATSLNEPTGSGNKGNSMLRWGEGRKCHIKTQKSKSSIRENGRDKGEPVRQWGSRFYG
jgi:hypothetical protein